MSENIDTIEVKQTIIPAFDLMKLESITAPASGFRTIRLIAKGDKSAIKGGSKAVNVPLRNLDSFLTSEELMQSERFTEYLLEALHDLEKRLCTKIATAGGAFVTAGDLADDKIIAMLEDESVLAGRITGTKYKEWFLESFGAVLRRRLAVVLKYIPADTEGEYELTEDQSKTIDTKLQAWGSVASSICTQSLPDANQRKSIETVFALIPEESRSATDVRMIAYWNSKFSPKPDAKVESLDSI